jgi:HTH-type transcriptional regulator/antitoxin MqsA
MQNYCSECGSSDFEVRIEPDDFQRNSQSFTAKVEFSVCRQCGEEVIFPEQIKRNDCVLRDAWRKIDGLLIAQEIVALRNKLQITQQEASKVFGGGVNGFSKYERSEVIQSAAMDKLMRLALDKPDTFLWLKQQSGLINNPPTGEVSMAKNTGDNYRNGSVTDRTQSYNPKTETWTKRDAETGKFMDQKADGTPFKGVAKEVDHRRK